MQPLGTFTISAADQYMSYSLAGAQPVVINFSSVSDVIVRNTRLGKRFDYTKQDRFGNPAPPATGMPNFLPEQRQWGVTIKRDGLPDVDIPMGAITNQGSWVNTEAGAIIAQTAIRDAIN